MCVRRLATEQPEAFAFTPENLDWAKSQLTKYPAGTPGLRGHPAVVAGAGAMRRLDARARDSRIADMLGMAFIRVYEIATFYTMFNLAPVGRYQCSFAAPRPAGCAAPMTLKAMPQSSSASRAMSPRTAISPGSRSNAWVPASTRRWSRSTMIITRT